MIENIADRERSGSARRHLPWGSTLVFTLLFGGTQIFAQTVPREASYDTLQFQSKIKESARALGNHPRLNNDQLKGLSDEQRENLMEFLAGNMLFVTMHELGHAAIQELGLPVLGREEDAADQFATLKLLNVNNLSHQVLHEASKGWFLSDRRDRRDGEEQIYYDEHGLDEQRAYQIVCLMVGSDPDKMAALAKETELPQDRQDTCVGQDYPRASMSWDMVLRPHYRAADRPKTKIDVVYGDGKGDFDVLAEIFRSTRLLEIVADHTSDLLAWPEPFVLETQSCGVINAHWDTRTRRLTLCYELAQDFAELYRYFNLVPQPPRHSKKLR